MYILEWILLLYVMGFIFKAIIGIPIMIQMPSIIKKVYAKELEQDNMYINPLAGIRMVLWSSISWPYFLWIQRSRFFYVDSKDNIEELFTEVMQMTKTRSQ